MIKVGTIVSGLGTMLEGRVLSLHKCELKGYYHEGRTMAMVQWFDGRKGEWDVTALRVAR